MTEKRDTFIRSLNRELYHQVRVVAVQQGITVGEAINQALALWLVREVQSEYVRRAALEREGR